MTTKKEIKEKIIKLTLNLLEASVILVISLYFIAMFIADFALFGYQSNLMVYFSIMMGLSLVTAIFVVVRRNFRIESKTG